MIYFLTICVYLHILCINQVFLTEVHLVHRLTRSPLISFGGLGVNCCILSFTLCFLYYIAVTVGFEPVDYVVDENNGTVTVHEIITSGTLEREICLQLSTVTGSAGIVPCICKAN